MLLSHASTFHHCGRRITENLSSTLATRVKTNSVGRMKFIANLFVSLTSKFSFYLFAARVARMVMTFWNGPPGEPRYPVSVKEFAVMSDQTAREVIILP